MKILLFVPASSVHMAYWAGAFVTRGHDLRAITMHEPPDGSVFPAPLRVLPTGSGAFKSGYLKVVPHVRREFSTFAPDATIAYYATSYGFLAARAGAFPLVVSTAGGDILPEQHRPGLTGRLQRYAASYALRRANLVLAGTDHMGDAAIRLGADTERLLVQPRGIDLASFPYRREEPPAPSATVPLRIVSTRSLRPVYRVDRLIEAASSLQHAGHRVELVVFGDGVARYALTVQARKAGIDPSKVFQGRCSSDEVARALAAAHVYVSLASSDGLSHSLLEAMATGPYPVVSDHPSNREWIKPGETGHLVSPADDLAAVLSAVAGAAALRRHASIANRRRVEARGSILENLGRIEDALVRLSA